MPGHYIKEDLRVVKTQNALYNALATLIKKRCFKKITVNDICTEALVSRAAFYNHFNDKYDLARSWLKQLRRDLYENYSKDELEKAVISFCDKYYKIICSFFEDNDSKSLNLIFEFFEPVFKISNDEFSKNSNLQIETLSDFCSGGMCKLLWQVYNKNPSKKEFKEIIAFGAKIVRSLIEWDSSEDV
jgi:hypothetical protein